MTFREVLQIELWSKQTSRRLLKVWGSVVVAIGVTAGSIYVLERNWITPHERAPAKLALSDIETLQGTGNSSEEAYSKQKEIADTAVQRAEESAWTWRDMKVSELLRGYASLIEIEHDKRLQEPLKQELDRKHSEYREMDSERVENSQHVCEFLSHTLHRVLD